MKRIENVLHGTVSCYHYGCRLPECVQAHTEAMRDYRARNPEESVRRLPAKSQYYRAMAILRDRHLEEFDQILGELREQPEATGGAA